MAALALLIGPPGCAWVTDAELAAATKGGAAVGDGGDGTDGSADPLWYRDGDGDGFGRPDDSQRAEVAPDGYVDNADDCDDSSAAVYPGAPETCADDVDQDCDGFDVLECRPEGELLLDAGDADLVLTGASGANIGHRMAAVDLDLDGDDELLLSDSTVGVQVVPGPLAPATSASVASRASGAFLETDALLAYPLAAGPAGHALLTLGMDHPSTFVDAVGGVALLGAEGVGVELDVDAVLVVGDAAGQSLAGSGAAWVDGAAGPLLLVADAPSDFAAQRLHVFGDPVTRRAAGLLEAGDADARVGPHSGSGTPDRGIGERALGCDLDGSGDPAVVVSAPGKGSPGEVPGVVYVFRGPLSGDVDAADAGGFVREPVDTWTDLGQTLACADLDGDGHADLIAGAPEGKGRVYAYSGAEQLTALRATAFEDARWQLQTERELQLGAQLATPDLDGDGRAELVVGAPGWSRTGAVDEGAALGWYGLPDGVLEIGTAEDADLVVTGEATDGLPFPVALACGRWSGGPWEDLALGQNGWGASNSGRAFVVFGGGAP